MQKHTHLVEKTMARRKKKNAVRKFFVEMTSAAVSAKVIQGITSFPFCLPMMRGSMQEKAWGHHSPAITR
jgi:hypothetical protein